LTSAGDLLFALVYANRKTAPVLPTKKEPFAKAMPKGYLARFLIQQTSYGHLPHHFISVTQQQNAILLCFSYQDITTGVRASQRGASRPSAKTLITKPFGTRSVGFSGIGTTSGDLEALWVANGFGKLAREMRMGWGDRGSVRTFVSVVRRSCAARVRLQAVVVVNSRTKRKRRGCIVTI
jgi:hypothetical protein